MKGRKRGLGSVVRFLETKGFYLVLSMCVIAVAVAGYMLFGGEDPVGNVVDAEDVLQQDELEVPNHSLKEDKDDSLNDVEDTEDPDAETQNPNPSDSDDHQVSNPVKVPETTHMQPVTGAVIRNFSGDMLVKDETMGDWRTHNGTDFACQKDEEALAFAAGTVIAVEERGLYGLCVTIDHGDGVVSTLAGLYTCRVKSGSKVTCGQVIGTCAGNLEAESAQESHVHLEVTKAGAYIDPLSFLNK